MWVVSPFLTLWAIVVMVIFQNSGSIGIKPKRYTIEWMQAIRERERQENTNPVTRYLDRRRTDRGCRRSGSASARRTRTPSRGTWTVAARIVEAVDQGARAPGEHEPRHEVPGPSPHGSWRHL